MGKGERPWTKLDAKMPSPTAWRPRTSASTGPMAATIQDVIATRLGRRDVLRGLAAIAVAAVGPGLRAEPADASQPAAGGSTLTFTEIPHGLDDRHHVAPGYSADVLIRRG